MCTAVPGFSVCSPGVAALRAVAETVPYRKSRKGSFPVSLQSDYIRCRHTPGTSDRCLYQTGTVRRLFCGRSAAFDRRSAGSGGLEKNIDAGFCAASRLEP